MSCQFIFWRKSGPFPRRTGLLILNSKHISLSVFPTKQTTNQWAAEQAQLFTPHL